MVGDGSILGIEMKCENVAQHDSPEEATSSTCNLTNSAPLPPKAAAYPVPESDFSFVAVASNVIPISDNRVVEGQQQRQSRESYELLEDRLQQQEQLILQMQRELQQQQDAMKENSASLTSTTSTSSSGSKDPPAIRNNNEAAEPQLSPTGPVDTISVSTQRLSGRVIDPYARRISFCCICSSSLFFLVVIAVGGAVALLMWQRTPQGTWRMSTGPRPTVFFLTHIFPHHQPRFYFPLQPLLHRRILPLSFLQPHLQLSRRI